MLTFTYFRLVCPQSRVSHRLPQAYVHPESPRGQTFSMHTEALDEHTRFWKAHRSVVNPNSADATSIVPTSFNTLVIGKENPAGASSPRGSPREVHGKMRPWLR